MKISSKIEQYILAQTGANRLINSTIIQALWSNYGAIIRVDLEGVKHSSVVVKQIQIKPQQNHPRGWNGSIGHARKIRSYEVEKHWYKHYAKQASAACRMPQCLGVKTIDDTTIIILEDLNCRGFVLRKQQLNWPQVKGCIAWLAHFHATFMHQAPTGLWPIGTYWHLSTRSEELEALQDIKLKQTAVVIDQMLNSCRYQTIVHGDAKIANFCFSEDDQKVAAVDFQYCGAGCGMKDLVYLVGSCMDERACERLETKLLDYYFEQLTAALFCASESKLIETEWRSMYRIAWADFHRFIKGWSPSHWKINAYSERITAELIQQLNL